MKKNTLKYVILISGLLGIFLFNSCDDIEDISYNSSENLNLIKMSNGILEFDNLSQLQSIQNLNKNNVAYQKEFLEIIKNLQSKGFKPLEPIFEENNPKMIEEFVKRKIIRLQKRDIDFGIITSVNFRSTSDFEDVDLDDELIFDPFLTSILNEEREIIIEGKLYKYTEMGLFICDDVNKNVIEKKQYLDNYLDALTVEERIDIINQRVAMLPCNPRGLDEVNDGINLFQDFLPCGESGGGNSGDGNTGNGNSTSVPQTYSPLTDTIKQNFQICNSSTNSLWELIFGTSDGCITNMANGKRVKTKYWNQNYFLFSSIGCRVKFQKHVETWLASWWEKSYADKLELGVNYVSYEYEYNVPAFNAYAYNQQTTFFEFNGTKYNVNGGVINSVPTGNGTFVFDTESDQSIMNITVLGYHLTNSNINSAIDLAVTQCVNGIQNLLVKYDLINKIQNGQIKYNIINAVPFDNKVKFFTKGVRWGSNNDNQIVRYFDMNFLVTWKSSSSSVQDYLFDLIGATAYKNVTVDIYGAAFKDNSWAGNRIKYNIN